uniref:Putative secreted protein n=1 Tax=Ixodes ricinus TaxID=34613 RepID=A0A6B0UZK1_IXORI
MGTPPLLLVLLLGRGAAAPHGAPPKGPCSRRCRWLGRRSTVRQDTAPPPDPISDAPNVARWPREAHAKGSAHTWSRPGRTPTGRPSHGRRSREGRNSAPGTSRRLSRPAETSRCGRVRGHLGGGTRACGARALFIAHAQYRSSAATCRLQLWCVPGVPGTRGTRRTRHRTTRPNADQADHRVI